MRAAGARRRQSPHRQCARPVRPVEEGLRADQIACATRSMALDGPDMRLPLAVGPASGWFRPSSSPPKHRNNAK